MHRSLILIAALACAMPLAACGPSVAERCASAKNPAECAQVAEAGGDVQDYLLYGMAGYMLSSAINGSGQRQAVIVPDPSYHGYRRPVPSYQASPARVRSTTTTTITKRGLFGGTKTTTRTTSWSSRSSYSGYRSSFRSSRR